MWPPNEKAHAMQIYQKIRDDQNEFERSREKLIAPDVAYDPIKDDPANDVIADIKQGYDPIVFENLC